MSIIFKFKLCNKWWELLILVYCVLKITTILKFIMKSELHYSYLKVITAEKNYSYSMITFFLIHWKSLNLYFSHTLLYIKDYLYNVLNYSIKIKKNIETLFFLMFWISVLIFSFSLSSISKCYCKLFKCILYYSFSSKYYFFSLIKFYLSFSSKSILSFI